MRIPAVREAKAGAWHYTRAPKERALSLARRPSRVGGRTPTCMARRARAANSPARGVARARGKRACCAFSPHRARAVAALLRTCASLPCARPRQARGSTALLRTRKPCRQRSGLLEPEGQNQLALRGECARQTRVLRLLPTQSACGDRSLAHMRKLAVREAKLVRGITPLHRTRESCR